MQEAAKEMWSIRTLHRNIYSQNYYRLLQSQAKDVVIDEMKQITAPMQGDTLEFIKNPVEEGDTMTKNGLERKIGKTLLDLLFKK